MSQHQETPNGRCPSAEELRDFDVGRLSAEAADAIALHVASCPRCQIVLKQLAPADDAITNDVQATLVSPPTTVDSVLALNLDVQPLAIEPDGLLLPGNSAVQPQDQATAVVVRCPHCREPNQLSSELVGNRVECCCCNEHFELALENLEASRDTDHLPAIAHFRLLKLLGEGSVGHVWKAEDTRLNRLVAIKIPRRRNLEPNETDSLLREAQAASKIRYPNIVTVHEVGVHRGSLFMVRDFVDGKPLNQLVIDQILSFDEATRICLQVARALQAAHEAGVVHRDLKPGNILIDHSLVPYVTDFGLAKYAACDITVTVEGRLLGTPAYMSPEQAKGMGAEADARSDIYSFGVVLYELLTGQTPFRGDPHTLVQRILLEDPPRPRRLNARVPKDLETISLKCLEKSPSRRYQTAAELADDLDRYLDRRPIRARPGSRCGRLYRWCRRKPALTALSAALAASVLAIIVILASANKRSAHALNAAETNLYYLQISSAQRHWQENSQKQYERALDACPEQLREFEWGYLRQLGDSTAHVLLQAGGPVVYSRDGKRLATAGGALPILKFWDPQSGEKIRNVFGHHRHINGIAFSLDDKYVATTSNNDATVRLWDSRSGKFIHTIGRHDKTAFDPQFTHDGKLLCTFDREKGKNRIKFWDYVTSTLVHEYSTGAHTVRDVALSPTHDWFAVAVGRQDTSGVVLRNYVTGETIGEIPCESNTTIMRMDFSADGQLLAVAENRGSIHLWQTAPLRKLRSIHGPLSNTPCLKFSPNGDLIAASAWDHSVCLWNTASLQLVKRLRGNRGPVLDLAFSPDGKQLACGARENATRIWDLSADQHRWSVTASSSSVCRVRFCPKGDLLVGTYNDGTVAAWDTRTRQQCWRVPGPSAPAWGIDFSPDGQTVVFTRAANVIELCATSSGKRLAQFSEHAKPVRCLAYSPKGELIASAGRERTVLIWTASTGEVVDKVPLKTQLITAVTFNDRGTLLAAGGRSGSVVLWDVAAHEVRWQTDPKRPQIFCLVFTPDNRLAVVRNGGEIELRQLDDGRLVSNYFAPADLLPVELAFCSGGRRFVTAAEHGAIELWEYPGGRHVLTLESDPLSSGCLAVHPDGKMIASGQSDGTVSLWPAADY